MNNELHPSTPEAAKNLANQHWLGVLRRRWLLIVAITIAVPAIVVASALQEQKMYTATAQLYFRSDEISQAAFGNELQQPFVDPARKAATELRLVNLPVVAERVARRIGDKTSQEIRDQVEVVPAGQSDLVSIQATNAVPRQAAIVANAFAEEFIAFRRAADRGALLNTVTLIERKFSQLPTQQQSGPRGQALQKRAQDLSIAASLQTGRAELVQRAPIPTDPSSPRPIRDGFLALIGALMLALLAAALRERLDTRLREVDDVEHMFQRPILSAVPRPSKRSRNTVEEAYSMLRANLRYFETHGRVETVVITSAEAGDGKSSVAWELAHAASRAGMRVAIVECDLRRPVLAERWGLATHYGLTDVLVGRVPLGDAVVSLPMEAGGFNLDDGRSVDVLVAGSPPPNPADLLASEPMQGLLEALRSAYDLTIIDTPPLTVVSDAYPLVVSADGVVVVVQLRSSHRSAAKRVAPLLSHLGARFLGVVVLNVTRSAGYGYENEYGDYQRAPQAADPPIKEPTAR